jgi:argininosuccinate synthase
MGRLIATLDELLARPPRHLVLLYSGGVDSSYLLQCLSGTPARVTALNVRVGTAPDDGHCAAVSERFGAAYREVDATGEFFAEFLPPAIHADAYYQGQFPVGSTLTRPLMARVGARLARELGADAVGHTSTYMQNSAARIGRSVAALAPELDLAAPFLGSYLSREEKLAALRDSGVHLTTSLHSVDANPWSRVIENGTLESPENRLAEDVFTWTSDLAACPADPVELTLTFAAGLPVALDDAKSTMDDLVPALNQLAGRHGVGRFSGLEDTPFGVKNHEVRESPAAAVITAAHKALANAVFGPREHAVRAALGAEWTTAVAHGGWFGHLGRCLARCLADLDAPVHGSVTLRLHYGTVTVLRVQAPEGLYYTRLGQEFHDWMRGYAYEPWHHLTTVADRSRSER